MYTLKEEYTNTYNLTRPMQPGSFREKSNVIMDKIRTKQKNEKNEIKNKWLGNKNLGYLEVFKKAVTDSAVDDAVGLSK